MATRGATVAWLGYAEVTSGDLWSDAWFLAAAHAAGNRVPATLAKVIGEGDWINRAILTPQEIEHAVRRLVPGGVLEVVGPDTFRVTSAGRKLVQRATRGTRSWPDVIDRLAIAVDVTLPLGSPSPVPGWSLDATSYAEACRNYFAEFDKVHRLLDQHPRSVGFLGEFFWSILTVWRKIRQLFGRY